MSIGKNIQRSKRLFFNSFLYYFQNLFPFTKSIILDYKKNKEFKKILNKKKNYC